MIPSETAPPKPDDDDREEGEILEEEEGEIRSDRDGEIERETADAVPDLAKDTVIYGKSIRPCENMSMEDNHTIEDRGVLNEKDDSESYRVKAKGFIEDAKNLDPRTLALNDKEHDTGSDGEARHRRTKSCTRESVKENKHRDSDTNDLRLRARSRSPHSIRDLERNRKALDGNGNYKDNRSSPETRRRDRSQSADRKRERSYEYQRGVRQDRVDRYVAKSRDGDEGALGERERSTSRSRYDLLGDRYQSQERGSERERNNSRMRERDDMEVDKGARRQRERSSSRSRRDCRDDRHGSRDRGRDRDRYSSSARDRDIERHRDTSRDRYKEREWARDDTREREQLKPFTDRDRRLTNDRERREHREEMENRSSNRDWHRDSRHSKYDERRHNKDRRQSHEFAKDGNSNAEEGKERGSREENEEVYLVRIEEQLAEREEEDIDKIKEESRKRRQAILEKYKQQQVAVQQRIESLSGVSDEGKDNLQRFDGENAITQAIPDESEIKHDPSDSFVVDPSFTVGKPPIENGSSALEKATGAGGLGEGTPKSERSSDMFCDDIFGDSPVDDRKPGKGDGVQIVRSGLNDNWDDADGYYSYRLGEVLDGHFEIKAFHGKGVFSTVVRAKDLKAGKDDPEEVAIKIIRNNDTMYKAGLEELIILKKLAGADPEDKRHCVRFLSSFKYRNHLCLVFESLNMNLREVLKKFGRNIGLNLTAVRAYAKQLFISLKHLKNCGVLHCDIKPDNMLVNEAKNVLKLCDFGNAMFAGKNEITPYLVSRFYRAPEIILGLPYDHPMDIWSVGCCLYEIYTGKVLFPGPSNNDMLRLHMELKGPFPKKMLRKGAFTGQHFDQDFNFLATEEDPVTKKAVKRLLLSIKPKEIGALISSSLGEDSKMLSSFKDLLERIFVLDPEKRMTVAQALSHPFITGK